MTRASVDRELVLPAATGAAAAAAGDAELEAFLHLYALNRGVLLTPFHNMALFTRSTRPPTSTATPRSFAERADRAGRTGQIPSPRA